MGSFYEDFSKANAYIGEEGETRREMILEAKRAKLEIRKNFFTTRAVGPWNNLPETTKKQTTINGFKNSYDSWKRSNTNQNSQREAAVTENAAIGSVDETQ